MPVEEIWKLLIGMSVTLLVLLAFSYPYVEPDSGTHVISVLSLVFILATLIGSLIVMYLGWEPFVAE